MKRWFCWWKNNAVFFEARKNDVVLVQNCVVSTVKTGKIFCEIAKVQKGKNYSWKIWFIEKPQ